MLVNKLNWISVEKAQPQMLDKLNSQMGEFYATFHQRKNYQEMIDNIHNNEEDTNSRIAELITNYIASQNFGSIVEFGCGSGRIYAQLSEKNYGGVYTGIEMASYVIEANKVKYPKASWATGSVYNAVEHENYYDACLAFFVLEHLIYPDKALETMLKVVKPGGVVILAFPDFCSSGIVPSQKIGLNYGGGAKQKLKSGNFVDAIISYFEASMMRGTLKKLNETYGNFVINYKPFCLDEKCTDLIPDIDAVYLSNKKEVEQWAKKSGCNVFYPSGVDGMMAVNAFLCIKKNK